MEATQMINTLIGILFSLILAVIVLFVNKFNDNPYNLTIRGKRVVFVLAFLLGLFINQVAVHLYWTNAGYIWK